MEKIIKIGDKDVRLDNNMAWTIEYRDQFGKDILPVLMPLISTVLETVAEVISETGTKNITLEDLGEAISGRAMDMLLPMYNAEFTELVLYVTWAMAKAADEDIAPPKQWIRQFDTFPVDVVVPEVLGMAAQGMISAKNLKRLKTIGASLQNLQPSNLTLSSLPESSEA